MGTNQDAVQRAEVGFLAMMCALLDSTLNALVCMTVHRTVPPYPSDGLSMPFLPGKHTFHLRLRLTFFLTPSIICTEYANFRKFVS